MYSLYSLYSHNSSQNFIPYPPSPVFYLLFFLKLIKRNMWCQLIFGCVTLFCYSVDFPKADLRKNSLSSSWHISVANGIPTRQDFTSLIFQLPRVNFGKCFIMLSHPPPNLKCKWYRIKIKIIGEGVSQW